MKLVDYCDGVKALRLGKAEDIIVKRGEKAKAWCAEIVGLHAEYKFERKFVKSKRMDECAYVFLEPDKVYDCYCAHGIEGVLDPETNKQIVHEMTRCFLHYDVDGRLKKVSEFDVYVMFRTNKKLKQIQDERRKAEREADAPTETSRFRRGE